MYCKAFAWVGLLFFLTGPHHAAVLHALEKSQPQTSTAHSQGQTQREFYPMCLAAL